MVSSDVYATIICLDEVWYDNGGQPLIGFPSAVLVELVAARLTKLGCATSNSAASLSLISNEQHSRKEDCRRRSALEELMDPIDQY